MISSCPISPEDLAEELYFGRLNVATTQTFQAHLCECHKCRGLNGETVAMIEAMRSAAKLLERTSAGNT